ncbi:MAG: 2-succinyl-5-enolpyruvyl-6-hydroxy-3-cyclohexene-carboxylic-acid synthase [Actinomycetia bacterium]|nr:2-succinyl-5-enolpyruvyl-6-hydroxy-3-cyclohexene-carboxylic-acid synthase [Actinomycetes bacterium]
MTERDATTAFAETLVDEWIRNGVSHAVVAPGSRSTPLALALAARDEIRVDVVLDERSAAFLALGIGKATGRPAVVLCTSGSAAAHLHPAVVEADHGDVPLLVCTADRPPELRDSGAGQTIDQSDLYGRSVRWFCDPGPPEDRSDAGPFWRTVAARSVAATVSGRPGPVHLNLPFREPLVPTAAPLVDAPGRADGAPWTSSTPAGLPVTPVELPAGARGLIVAGWGAERAMASPRDRTWPVFADPLSGLRSGPMSISAYEALLRVPGFADAHRPDLVLRVGAPVTSKLVNQWLDPSIEQLLVDPDGRWLDPQHAASRRIAGSVAITFTGDVDPSWRDAWLDAEKRARDAIDATLDGFDSPFDGRIARDVAAALPDGSTLFVASSMPVRELEYCMLARAGLRVVANRGVNGIDGATSTILGLATARGAGAPPVVGILGDLAFLHDTNGLLGAARRGIDATLVLLDNDGGGIFSFLPQATALDPGRFETLFGTPQGVDLEALCTLHDVAVTRVTDPDAVVPALRESIAFGGIRVLLVKTDRHENVERHAALWSAVAAAL